MFCQAPVVQVLESEKALLEKKAAEEGPESIVKPEHWLDFQIDLPGKNRISRGGFLLRPRYFEFWQGQSDRLHDRCYFQIELSKYRFVPESSSRRKRPSMAQSTSHRQRTATYSTG